MPAMTGEQTASYITHHLKLAGRSDPLFSDAAVTLIHDASAHEYALQTTPIRCVNASTDEWGQEP